MSAADVALVFWIGVFCGVGLTVLNRKFGGKRDV